MPMPDFPLARIASSAGIVRMSSSCRVQSSRFALGRSILLMTGMTLSFCANARWALRHGLRLDALPRVDQEHGALAGRQRAGDFVGEVHVAGRVHEVQLVVVTVLRAVGHRDRVRLDRDAALLLEVHRVEVLRRSSRACETVLVCSSSRSESVVFAVVDVGDDAEIAGVFGGHRFRQRDQRTQRNSSQSMFFRCAEPGQRAPHPARVPRTPSRRPRRRSACNLPTAPMIRPAAPAPP